MKSLTTFALLFFLMIATRSFAQHDHQRSALFASYPSTITCTEAELSALFQANTGQSVNARLGNVLPINGQVVSKEQRYQNLRLLTLRLPAYQNILLSVSERLDENNRPVYMAHLMDKKYSDGYQLKRQASGSYQLVKIEMDRILNDCAHE